MIIITLPLLIVGALFTILGLNILRSNSTLDQIYSSSIWNPSSEFGHQRSRRYDRYGRGSVILLLGIALLLGAAASWWL